MAQAAHKSDNTFPEKCDSVVANSKNGSPDFSLKCTRMHFIVRLHLNLLSRPLA